MGTSSSHKERKRRRYHHPSLTSQFQIILISFPQKYTKLMQDLAWTVSESHPYEWDENENLAYLDRAGIGLQMLSYIPKDHSTLRKANDFCASVVSRHPSRYGMLAALPTDDAGASISEIDRVRQHYTPDGYALSSDYNGVYLGDARLSPLWAKLNELHAVIFLHPNAWRPAIHGRPTPLIEAPFETTRTVVDMLYAGVFRHFPDMTWIVAHGGGCIPLLADRLELLGTEPWVPNPNHITKDEVKKHLSKLYVDTAAVGCAALQPAIDLVGKAHLVYGADCGVPCSTEATMEENKKNILGFKGLTEAEKEDVMSRTLKSLFPAAAARMSWS